MARNQRDFTFDAAHELKDAGLVAASAAAQVDGSAKIVDLGEARVDARVIVDITAIEVATGDEAYTIRTQFSDSATFASGIVNGPSIQVGDSSVTGASADDGTGRREIGFTNEINGVTYRYMRLYTTVDGTIATGINYSAFIAKD